MLRAIILVCSSLLLSACITTDARVSAKSEQTRNARVAASPLTLGTGY